MKQAKFLVMEGCDGSGKTTVAQAVYKRLKEEGVDIIYTREPGGIDISEQIRAVILDPKNTAMNNRTEALLYAAGRRQHLVEKILPAMEKGQWVLCDRFVFSSLAYQGYARGIGMEEVMKINEFALEGVEPGHTIFLDIPAEVGLERINRNRSYLDRLDQEGLDFHNRVFQGYQEVLKKYGKDTKVIDANRPAEDVIEDVYKYLVEECGVCAKR